MVSNAFDRPTDGPSLDRVFGVLANERRRGVLYYLREGADDTTNVETLANHIAKSDSDALETTDRREQAIAIELSHVHLPKLDTAEVVEYAPDSGIVEYVGNETVEALLDATTAEN